MEQHRPATHTRRALRSALGSQGRTVRPNTIRVLPMRLRPAGGPRYERRRSVRLAVWSRHRRSRLRCRGAQESRPRMLAAARSASEAATGHGVVRFRQSGFQRCLGFRFPNRPRFGRLAGKPRSRLRSPMPRRFWVDSSSATLPLRDLSLTAETMPSRHGTLADAAQILADRESVSEVVQLLLASASQLDDRADIDICVYGPAGDPVDCDTLDDSVPVVRLRTRHARYS